MKNYEILWQPQMNLIKMIPKSINKIIKIIKNGATRNEHL
jgi:hypothetical protein